MFVIIITARYSAKMFTYVFFFSFHNYCTKKISHCHALFIYWKFEHFKTFTGVMELLRPRAEVWIKVCLDSRFLYINYCVILQLSCILEMDELRKQNGIFIFFPSITFSQRMISQNTILDILPCHLLLSRVSWNKLHFKKQN